MAMTLLCRYDVRKFDAEAILYGDTRCMKMDISMFERCFQCGFGLNKVKYAKKCPLSLFLHFLQIFPGCFLQGEINCWGEQDRNISAPVSAPVSALYMTFGSKGWTALFDLVDMIGPKV